jgi:hypothetical protein
LLQVGLHVISHVHFLPWLKVPLRLGYELMKAGFRFSEEMARETVLLPGEEDLVCQSIGS